MTGVRIGILNVCDIMWDVFYFHFYFLVADFQIYQMLGAGYGLFELLFSHFCLSLRSVSFLFILPYRIDNASLIDWFLLPILDSRLRKRLDSPKQFPSGRGKFLYSISINACYVYVLKGPMNGTQKNKK